MGAAVQGNDRAACNPKLQALRSDNPGGTVTRRCVAVPPPMADDVTLVALEVESATGA